MSPTLKRLCAAIVFVSFAAQPSAPSAATPEDLYLESNQALSILLRENLIAMGIAKKAKAVLIFPT